MTCLCLEPGQRTEQRNITTPARNTPRSMHNHSVTVITLGALFLRFDSRGQCVDCSGTALTPAVVLTRVLQIPQKSCHSLVSVSSAQILGFDVIQVPAHRWISSCQIPSKRCKHCVSLPMVASNRCQWWRPNRDIHGIKVHALHVCSCMRRTCKGVTSSLQTSPAGQVLAGTKYDVCGRPYVEAARVS